MPVDVQRVFTPNFGLQKPQIKAPAPLNNTDRVPDKDKQETITMNQNNSSPQPPTDPDQYWKKWIGHVFCGSDEEIKFAMDTLKGKQPKDAKELQKIINEIYTAKASKVLQDAEEQHKNCPY